MILYAFIFDYRSQLQPEHSLLRGFEDEVIVEKSRRANELVLPDLLLSSSHGAGGASKSAPTPRIISKIKVQNAILLFFYSSIIVGHYF